METSETVSTFPPYTIESSTFQYRMIIQYPQELESWVEARLDEQIEE